MTQGREGKLMLDIIMKMACPLFMTVLAIDLLYLWVVEAWYDSIIWVEALEVLILCIVITCGIFYSILVIRRILRSNDGQR